MKKQFRIQYCRYHAADNRKLLLCGVRETKERDHRLVAALDYQLLSSVTEVQRRIRSIRMYMEAEQREFLWVTLPEDYESYQEFRVFERSGTELLEIFHMDVEKLKQMWRPIPAHIDEIKKTDGGLQAAGWYIAQEAGGFELQSRKGREPCKEVRYLRRPDVENAYPEVPRDWVRGFHVQLAGRSRRGRLCIRCGERTCLLRLAADGLQSGTRMERAGQALRKVQVYYQQFGTLRTLYRCYEKLTGKEDTSYEIFRMKYMPGRGTLERQREEVFPRQPDFAVVVPLYHTPEPFLDAMVRSVCEQTYGRWRLYLSDGSGPDSPLKTKLEEYAAKDERICVIANGESLGIVENTNRALSQVQEEYIAFLDHDDMLSPDALYECVRVLNEEEDTQVLYSDEDKVTADGKRYYQPHFKPDLNLDLLRSANYICHLFVVSRELLEQAGYLRTEYEGSQDYDLILRCVEETDRIVHIPKILYHWRVHPNSVAGDQGNKAYAYEAGRRAIADHYRRVGIRAEIHFMTPGYYRSVYQMDTQPLVSVIIPNKDHRGDLERCVESIQRQQAYRSLEILIVENNSTSAEIFSYYREVARRYDNVKILFYDKEFNYSVIQNFAAAKAAGEYFLFLNNDTCLLNEEGIREMVSYCTREDVGIVGAKLLYPDDTIQHAGVVVGLGGVAGHAFLGSPAGDPGYFCRITCVQDYSAVTAACMMVKKKAFLAAGGMDPALAVAFNDTDFCLRVGELGYRIVYNPFSVWRHEESKTRGAEDTPEKVERFQREIAFFQSRWKEFLERGDPNYSPNLTLDRHDFSLRL